MKKTLVAAVLLLLFLTACRDSGDSVYFGEANALVNVSGRNGDFNISLCAASKRANPNIEFVSFEGENIQQIYKSDLYVEAPGDMARAKAGVYHFLNVGFLNRAAEADGVPVVIERINFKINGADYVFVPDTPIRFVYEESVARANENFVSVRGPLRIFSESIRTHQQFIFNLNSRDIVNGGRVSVEDIAFNDFLVLKDPVLVINGVEIGPLAENLPFDITAEDMVSIYTGLDVADTERYTYRDNFTCMFEVRFTPEGGEEQLRASYRMISQGVGNREEAEDMLGYILERHAKGR